MKAEQEQESQLRGFSSEERERLMVQAAKLYYDLERTQSEVGRELGLTRWQVARLLREAREIGVLRIEIAPRARRLPALESALQRTFALREAIIIPDLDVDEQALLGRVAAAAAQYLTALNPKPRLVGVSWGRTMAAVAEHLASGWNVNVEVVLLNGATHVRGAAVPANSIAERFAAAGPGTATLLPVPAIVGKATTREALVADPVIAPVLALGVETPVACFGLGGLLASSVLVESGYIDAAATLRLRSSGAVGDVLGRFIDAEGRIVDPELDSRTIGLAPAALRQKDVSIGVSTGLSKHAVVLAALRARYINVLVSDAATARYVLEKSNVH